MSQRPLIPLLLTAKNVLRRVNPDLLNWSNRQWNAWLQTQRSTQADAARRRLIIVAALTCIEDMPLHIGLAQLLGTPWLRCTVVLSLPTEDMARLVRAQARREEWHMLVDIVAETKCADMLRRLPPTAPLVVFSLPTILSPDALDAVTELSSSPDAGREWTILPEGAGFVGRAQDYGAWLDADNRAAVPSFSVLLRPLASADPKHLGSAADISQISTRAEFSHTKSDWQGTVHAEEGRIELPSFGPDDELVVRAFSGDGESAAIVRKSGDLRIEGENMCIRVPASLLTVDPRSIRLEARKTDGSMMEQQLVFRVPPSRLQPWMVSAFLNRGGAGNSVVRAFAAGVGCRLAYAEDEPEILGDIPVVWGVLRHSDRLVAQAKAQKLYFFYIDHAYFNRGHGRSYRITRDAYEAGPIRRCPTDRLAALGMDIAPWRKSGRDIIVCPPTEYFMQAHGCPDWLETTLSTLATVTDRPINVRQKPKPGEEAVPLHQALKTAYALVTHSSNVAIEAACLGTPVFVSPASAAAPIGRTDLLEIETPAYPDRESWLAHLAYNEFSLDEIQDGRAWRMLLDLEERELV